MKKNILLIVCFLVLSIISCKQKKVAKKEKDIKKSDIEVKIIRFDKLLFESNANDMANELKKLQQQHSMFSEVYFDGIMSYMLPQEILGKHDLYVPYYKEYITNPNWKNKLYDTVVKRFPNVDFLEDELQTAFANYKSYFPNKPIPKVYTCISSFYLPECFTFEDTTQKNIVLGICIDDFLGKEYKFYKSEAVELYDYQLYSANKNFMAIKSIKALATNTIQELNANATYLDKLIYYGKIYYFIQCMLPQKPPEDIIIYAKKDLDWCNKNEAQIWSFVLDNKLLYETKTETDKYFVDGPTTNGMPKESPGKVGAWLGWKIIQKYMQEKPNTTLQQLINETNSQKILTESKYKPKN